MNNKKQIKIDRFDNFSSNNSIICDSYFNLKADKKLSSSHGVENAKFPKGLGLDGEYELNLAGSGIDEVKGVTYFKQFFSINYSFDKGYNK